MVAGQVAGELLSITGAQGVGLTALRPPTLGTAACICGAAGWLSGGPPTSQHPAGAGSAWGRLQTPSLQLLLPCLLHVNANRPERAAAPSADASITAEPEQELCTAPDALPAPRRENMEAGSRGDIQALLADVARSTAKALREAKQAELERLLGGCGVKKRGRSPARVGWPPASGCSCGSAAAAWCGAVGPLLPTRVAASPQAACAAASDTGPQQAHRRQLAG